MENKIDILNELKELSQLIAGMEKVNVFTVPGGYFEHLSADIMTGISTEQNIQLVPLASNLENDVPTGYFDSLSSTILSKIKSQQNENTSDEIRNLSPMLYSIQNENVFEVPTGYFDGLSQNVLGKVVPKKARLVTMQKRTTTFLKYAVAAVFTGVMALGVFKFTGNVSPKVELPAYVAQGMKVKNVDAELAKISDADIIKFLQTNPENFDAQTVANKVINENELPSQMDYMVDDQALDNYLNNINISEADMLN